MSAIQRRALLLAALAAPAGRALADTSMPDLRPLRFPRDFGSHPDWRTEWWYITGHAEAPDAGGGTRSFGFQVTFFRSRIDAAKDLRSAFAARQVVFAHAALTDLKGRHLWHDQRIARAGMGVAFASEGDTDVRLRDWSLKRQPGGSYAARVGAADFSLSLDITPSQAVLLQGDAGLSRKGADPREASYYYSEPQLQVQGRVGFQGQEITVRQGRAWLDHEWSETIMSAQAVGWDWIGMNLHDGSALTAFRLRDRSGQALWAGGSWRSKGGELRVFSQDDVRFEPVRRWTSPSSRATYPVEWTLATPAGKFTVRSLLDDQELDSRGSTGTIYWEGVSDLLDERGQPLGRGYLEMTGYASALKL
ncbi:lipocalin-like domain-containing protein [Variovorax sp. OV329]|uniref:lipocalin-like domain-containing protein n=1 Tax=Variovorax sp. OV329 TaxID=1882825 RepID=UPI0008EF08DA|nr:carotenoid 1,2-hydratase [Variovorax sp. OV329]SFM52786.1 Predicted secreted hydrolase [Variovorax sp. OV329]